MKTAEDWIILFILIILNVAVIFGFIFWVLKDFCKWIVRIFLTNKQI